MKLKVLKFSKLKRWN